MNTINNEILKATCCVEDIRYYKNEWGIVKCSISNVKEGSPHLDKYGCAIFKGVMPQLKEKNSYNIIAEYVEDPKWGGQYNIISIFSSLDFGENDPDGKKRFLSSIFTDLQIKNMYEVLDDPFQTLKDKDVYSLVKVKNCGIKTAEVWIRRFFNHLGAALIYSELVDYNLTTNMVNRLMNRYKSPELVVEKVKSNPYVLCTEVDGIGWKTADKIALEGGIDLYSPLRIGAYILNYLDTLGEQGCSWITPDQLLGAIIEELGEDVPDKAISVAIKEQEEKLWWDNNKTKIGLKKYYIIEEKVAKELIRLRDAPSSITYKDFDRVVSQMEEKQGWTYTEEQLNGAKVGLDNNLVVITGSGGTGKTSMVGLILEVLKEYSFAQTALSGRAAARMQEVTGEEGYTIHRLLGWPSGDPDKQKYTYHDENQLDFDIYIIDEISMIDSYLFYYLLRAIPSGSKVFLLGDPGQLQAIGCGNVAYDMIRSDEITTVTLTKIHRQAAKSAIITESIKVRNGQQLIEKDWAGTETRGELQDLTLKCFSDKSNTYYEVMKAFNIAFSSKDFNIMQEQVLSPIKTKGSACTFELNNAIQELYNPKSPNKKEYTGVTQGRTYILREGDKVINTCNNYKTQPPIFNGNIGILKRFSYDNELDEEIMVIDFLEIGEVNIPKENWNNIELAYAITCHKVQGSEFDHVIFALDITSYALLTRELVYTGITRAKKKCELIAQNSALRMAVAREAGNTKQTHLVQCLYDIAHPKLIF